MPVPKEATVFYRDVVGLIIDISPGGLAFKYVPWNRAAMPLTANSNEQISLMHLQQWVMVDNTPCKSVADVIFGPFTPWSKTMMRRHSIAFSKMSSSLEAQLDAYIAQITKAEPSDSLDDTPYIRKRPKSRFF